VAEQGFRDPYASDPWCLWPRLSRRMTVLERAVYSTIAYRDIFAFPPTLAEIHRYLHGVRCSKDDIADSLSRGELCDGLLETDGTFFALRGRSQLFSVRRERELRFQQYVPLASHYARMLASLPHVRMVALTGSLAARNPGSDLDIDFMLVTDSGRMWLSRGCAVLIARIEAFLGRRPLCANLIITKGAISLERKSLYDAHEIAQMVPVYGWETYQEFRAANPWSKVYLPNADGPPEPLQDIAKLPLSALKAAATWLTRSRIGQWVEDFEATRKVRRFNMPGTLEGRWTTYTREMTGLRADFYEAVDAAWTRRMRALESSEEHLAEEGAGHRVQHVA